MAAAVQDEGQDASHFCEINIAAALGRSRAFDLFEGEMEKFEAGLKELRIWNNDFERAAGYLYRLVPAAS